MASLDPNATTFSEMVDEIVGNLLGYVRDQEPATHLVSAAAAADTQLAVGSVSQGAGVGAAEIDDELVWVSSVDRTNATLAIAPYGRGYQGTTAADHDANTRVTFSPRFPRHKVKRAINQTITAIGDQLPAVGTVVLTADAVSTTYELPAAAEEALEVTWQSIGPTNRWIPVKRWNTNQKANVTAFTTGKSIDILDRMTPGQPVQVTYIKNPTLFDVAGDAFSVTGLPASAYDVVVYGTMSRLLAPIGASRLDFKSVEADQLDTPTPFESSQNLSKYFQQLFLMRLEEERKRLFSRFQPRVRRM